MKKKIGLASLLIIGCVVLFRCLNPHSQSQAEIAATKIANSKLIDIPDSLKNMEEIVAICDFHEYAKEFSKQYLQYYKNKDKATIEETQTICVKNWGCLWLAINSVGLKAIGLNNLSQERIQTVLNGNKVESLMDNGNVVGAINMLGKEHEDALRPERFQKYFEFYAYIVEESNKKIEEILSNR